VAPELMLALIQIVLGLTLGFVGAFLARTRPADSGTDRGVLIGRTVVALGIAATLIGVVGVAGASEIISGLATALTQSVIALVAIAAAVRFCLRLGRTPTS